MLGLNKRMKQIEIENRKKRISKLGEELTTEANLATLREKELGLRQSIAQKKGIAKSMSGPGFGSNLKSIGSGLQNLSNYAAKIQNTSEKGSKKRKDKGMFGSGGSWL